MAKHACDELDLQTSARFPAKFVKRSHSADGDTRNLMGSHPGWNAAAAKRLRDAVAVAVVPQPLALPLRPHTSNTYAVEWSEMMAFFSLLGMVNMYRLF